MGVVGVEATAASNSGGTFIIATTALEAVKNTGGGYWRASLGASSISATQFATPTIPAGAQIRSVRAGNSNGSYLDSLSTLVVRPNNITDTPIMAVPINSGTPGYYPPGDTLGLQTQWYAPMATDATGAAWTTASIANLAVTYDHPPTASNDAEVTRKVVLEVTYNAQPVVGTVTFDPVDLATVNYSFTDAEGDGQEARRIKIFTDAVKTGGGFNPETSTAVYDSGVVYAPLEPGVAATINTGVRLMTAGTYWAYVKMADAGSNLRWSAWANDSAIVNLSRVAPTVTLLSEPATGRVKLTVTDDGSAYTKVAQRSDDGGLTWVELPRLRSGTGYDVLVPSAWTNGYDYEAPRGKAVQYRARIYGASNGSPWSTVQSVTVPAERTWLKDPLNPVANWQGAANGPIQSTRREPQAVLAPLGAAYPVVLSGALLGDVVAGAFAAPTEADRLAFEALRNTQRTLLLQSISGRQWYIRLGSEVTSVPVEASEDGLGAAYLISFTAVEVAPP